MAPRGASGDTKMKSCGGVGREMGAENEIW